MFINTLLLFMYMCCMKDRDEKRWCGGPRHGGSRPHVGPTPPPVASLNQGRSAYPHHQYKSRLDTPTFSELWLGPKQLWYYSLTRTQEIVRLTLHIDLYILKPKIPVTHKNSHLLCLLMRQLFFL